jgi:hypothetical protein
LNKNLPSADDLAKFLTRAELEDALQGIRKDFESKLPNLDDFAHFVTWAGLEDALQGISGWQGVELIIHFILKQPYQNVCLHFKGNENIILLREIRVLSQKRLIVFYKH